MKRLIVSLGLVAVLAGCMPTPATRLVTAPVNRRAHTTTTPPPTIGEPVTIVARTADEQVLYCLLNGGTPVNGVEYWLRGVILPMTADGLACLPIGG